MSEASLSSRTLVASVRLPQWQLPVYIVSPRKTFAGKTPSKAGYSYGSPIEAPSYLSCLACVSVSRQTQTKKNGQIDMLNINVLRKTERRRVEASYCMHLHQLASEMSSRAGIEAQTLSARSNSGSSPFVLANTDVPHTGQNCHDI